MRLACLIALLAGAPAAAADAIYTNEEEVYFAAEKGQAAIPWTGVAIAERGNETGPRRIDVFGKTLPGSVRVANITPERLSVVLDDGRTTTLRRARPVTCWTAIPKAIAKADGSPDWYFVRDLKIHDQGGRAAAGGDGTGAKPLVLRMRNVIWSEGPNRPSLVLYVHTPDAPDKAVSYSWADPEAKRIGINLRWMQASCTIDNPQGGTK